MSPALTYRTTRGGSSGSPTRVDIDGHAAAAEILDGMASAARDSGPASRWAVAMPDPFDYERGIGRFHGVGKFESLDGVDVRSRARAAVGSRPGRAALLQRRGRVHRRRVAGRRRLAEQRASSASRSGRASAAAGSTTATSSIRAYRRAVERISCSSTAPRSRTSMSRRAIRRAYAARDRRRRRGRARDRRPRPRRRDSRAGSPCARAALRSAARSLHRSTTSAPTWSWSAARCRASWELFEPWFREGAGESAVAARPGRRGLRHGSAVRRRLRRYDVPMTMRGWSAGRSHRRMRTS